MGVLKYYDENKALSETWKQGQWKLNIILLRGSDIYVKQLSKPFLHYVKLTNTL